MKRVLQVVGSLRIGGLETVAMNCVKYADSQKYQFDFLVYGEEIGDMEHEAVALGAKVIHISSPKAGYVQYCKELKHVLRSNGPYDIVHAHTYFSSALPIMIAKKCGVPYCIAHSHSMKRYGDGRLNKKILYFIMRKMLNHFANRFCACSAEAGKWVFGEKEFLHKGIVLPNTIDIDAFAYDMSSRESTRTELKISSDSLVIGCVGRLVGGKNIKHLLNIFSVYKQNRNSVLILVGDGMARQELEEYANILGIKGDVRFTGARTDVPKLLSAMDIFVMPSKHEGFGIVLIEAMANGLTCIVNTQAIVKAVKALPMCKCVDGWNIDCWVDEIQKQEQNGRFCRNPEAIRMLDEYRLEQFSKKLDEIYR